MSIDPAAAKRVALVIGNGKYTIQPPLRNPVPDAKAIAARLREANFEVTLGIDLTNQAMREKINEFAATVPGAKAALLYFAGHGVQVNGENYLIPVDASIERVADLTWQTIAVSTLVSELEGYGRTSIIILDACRNNPGLARRLRGLSTRTRALNVGRGLAHVAAPDGAYVAFSTAPNTVALDGNGENSPFAQALIKHLPTPGLDIALMMRKVRREVRKLTGEQQTPWDSSSLTQPFYFVPAKAKAGRAPPEGARRPSTAIERLRAREAYGLTEALATCDAYDNFLASYPDGFLAGLAKAWKRKNCRIRPSLARTPQASEEPPLPAKHARPPAPVTVQQPPVREPSKKSTVRRTPVRTRQKRKKPARPRIARPARTKSRARRKAGQNSHSCTACMHACFQDTARKCGQRCSGKC